MIQSPDNRMLRRTTTTISGTMAAHQTQDDLCKKGNRSFAYCTLEERVKRGGNQEFGLHRGWGCINTQAT